MSSRIKIPLHIIELDYKSFHILIEASINSAPVNLIIDTGASRTVFDKSLLGANLQLTATPENEDIHSAGLIPGNIESVMAVAGLFRLGDMKLTDFPVVLINLEEMNKLYFNVTGKQVHGLLGSDFLLDMKAKIDYKNLVLSIKRK